MLIASQPAFDLIDIKLEDILSDPNTDQYLSGNKPIPGSQVIKI